MDPVAHFDIFYTRYLDPQGQVTQSLPALAENSEHLIQLYRMMVLTRAFDTRAIQLQRTGQMGTYASSLGQEAVAVGLGAAMKPDDILCPAYREYGAQLQRGIQMSEILIYWGGDERGNNYANNTVDFPMCVPIASQCLHAAGAAVAIQYRKQSRVVVVVCGDGATSQGDFYEAMNLAGAWQLPIVFVINNNQWAISVPRSAQSGAQTLAQKAIAGGFSGEQVDGNDVIAVEAVMQKAIEKARTGGGPSLVEALTYRLSDHTTADDAGRYRPAAELEQAKAEEPIGRLRQYLVSIGQWSEQAETALLAECAVDIETAVTTYLSLKPESPTAMFDYMYETLPAALQAQRDELKNKYA
jgi:2-oxoisovalerate dehydrogenase E1 component alpha subunit